MTDREEFEKWIKSEKPKTNLQKRDGRYLFADASSSWKAWQVAIAHERERCAKVCESLGITTNGIYERNQDCADAIRKGE